MNQSYVCVNAPYATFTCAICAKGVLGVQMYKINNACALLLRNLNILNSGLLQHARSVCGVCECEFFVFQFHLMKLDEVCVLKHTITLGSCGWIKFKKLQNIKKM